MLSEDSSIGQNLERKLIDRFSSDKRLDDSHSEGDSWNEEDEVHVEVPRSKRKLSAASFRERLTGKLSASLLPPTQSPPPYPPSIENFPPLSKGKALSPDERLSPSPSFSKLSPHSRKKSPAMLHPSPSTPSPSKLSPLPQKKDLNPKAKASPTPSP